MTVATALCQGKKLLERGNIPTAWLTAEVLLCHALHWDRSRLYSHPEEELAEIAWIHYGRYLHERLQGKPTQYITKRQEFYGRDFGVTPDVLIPRPETEHVVETALRLVPGAGRLVDAGCGSGAIAVTLALEMPAAQVAATDISAAALRVAHDNAARLGASVQLICCDLLEAVGPRSMDLVVSNPPYVPDGDRESLQREVRDYEPALALFGGPTGVEIYERLIAGAARVLRPGGWLIMEIGYCEEGQIRRQLGAAWHDAETVPDLAGIPRVVAARLG